MRVLDPNTHELFGHILASVNAEDFDTETIVISSLYAGSNRIFEYLMSQCFRFAVQKDACNIVLISANAQGRSLAKRMSMIQTRGALPKSVRDIANERAAECYIGDYYETLAHPDFVGLFASDSAPYPDHPHAKQVEHEAEQRQVS